MSKGLKHGQEWKWALAEAKIHLYFGWDSRVVLDGDWGRRMPLGYVISPEELESIQGELPEDSLLELVQDALEEVLPLEAYKLHKYGYGLAVKDRAVVICEDGYDRTPAYEHDGERQQALAEVREMVEQRIAEHRQEHPLASFPVWGSPGKATLVGRKRYAWLESLTRVSHPRPQDVVALLYAAVPDIRDEWMSAGYRLEVVSYASPKDRRMQRTNIRLMSANY